MRQANVSVFFLVRLCWLILSFCSHGESFSVSDRADACKPIDSEIDKIRCVVEAQLGYQVKNFVKVSAWHDGEPLAIQTYPLMGGSPRRQARAKAGPSPFPTLFWLTHPIIHRRISQLEQEGCVKMLQDRLEKDEKAMEQYQKSQLALANLRWSSMTEADQEALGESQRFILKETGTTGNNGNHIKCLHAQYAHYTSVKDGDYFNPVGAWIEELLECPEPIPVDHASPLTQ